MRRSPITRAALPAAVVALAVVVLGALATRVGDWAVMTDELQYAKLADSIAESLSLVPRIHGETIGAIGQVYPLVLAPLFGVLDAQGAISATRLVNALLFASSAVPAYLLARQVIPAAARIWAAAVSLLTVAVPWSVLTGFVMSESVAYPVFLWTALALQRAIAAPSAQRDALALGAIMLAYFTRTQFVALAVVLPLAVLAHELRMATPARAGLARALARHRVVAGAYATGLLVVVALAAAGSPESILGRYAVTATEGSIVSSGLPEAIAVHLGALGAALCIVPLVFGLGWALSVSIDRDDAGAQAFAVLVLLTVGGLVLEGSSFDLRFGGEDVIRDRYLFYVAPLLLVGSVAWLLDSRRRLVAPALVTVAFAATAPLVDWPVAAGVSLDRVSAVLRPLVGGGGTVDTGTYVALAGLLLCGTLLATRTWLPRVPVAIATVAILFVLLAGETGYAFHRLLGSYSPSGRPISGSPGQVFNWVDTVIPGDTGTGVVPYPISEHWGPSALLWWDVEYYNGSIERSYTIDGHFTYTPYPSQELELDWSSGRITTDHEAQHLVVAAGDSRLRIAGAQRGVSYGLEILDPVHPYRAEWASRGLDPDGYVAADRPATVRVYGGENSGRVAVSVALKAPPGAAAPVGYTLAGSAESVAPGMSADATTTVCVPARGHADVTLTAPHASTEPGPPFDPEPGPPMRRVGPKVDAISLERSGEPC